MSVQQIVESYVQTTCTETGKISESLASIAEKTGVSVATAFRAVQEMQKKQLVKVIPSRARAKPATIVFLGNIDQENNSLTDLGLNEEKATYLVKILLERLKKKQQVIESLKQDLDAYLSAEVIATVNLPGDIEAVFRRVDKEKERDIYGSSRMECSQGVLHQ